MVEQLARLADRGESLRVLCGRVDTNASPICSALFGFFIPEHSVSPEAFGFETLDAPADIVLLSGFIYNEHQQAWRLSKSAQEHTFNVKPPQWRQARFRDVGDFPSLNGHHTVGQQPQPKARAPLDLICHRCNLKQAIDAEHLSRLWQTRHLL